MTTEPNRAKAVFLEAVDKATPTERAAFLEHACAGDGELRRRVEALLHAHECDHSVLDRPAAEQFAGLTGTGPDGSSEIKAARALQDESLSTSNGAASAANEVLAFLAPAQRPGSLGRMAHFEMLEILGQGGFGTVFKAFDERLHRIVAIKVLAPQLAVSATAQQRFLREAKSAAAVRHEHVIGIHMVEERPLPYLVMECIDGQTLQQKLDRMGSLPVKEILRIGTQIGEGLAAAHKHGLIHRDIKPANILLENGVERVRLSDFGLARTVDDASLSQSGLVAGTPQYMSPEQAAGEQVDQRSDLFSLGSVLYVMCTGHLPFRADSALAVLKRVYEETPRPIRDINPDIPDWLAAIVHKLHAKKPADRFQSAREVADLLARYLADLQIHGRVLEPAEKSPGQSNGQATTAADGETEVASPLAKRKRSVFLPLLVLVSLAVMAVAAAVVIPLLRDVRPEAAPGPGNSKGGNQNDAPSPLDRWTRADIPPHLLALVGGGDPEQAPAELVAVLGDGRFSLTGERLGGMTLSPDGKLLAVPCANQVHLFDTETGYLVRQLAQQKSQICEAAFSANGKKLATGAEDGTVRLWEVESGKALRTLGKHKNWAMHVCFGPQDETVLSSSPDGTARVWDIATGGERHQLQHPDHVHGLAVSPDGKWVVTGCNDRSVRVWDIATGLLEKTFAAHSDHVYCVRFSPNGELLATGSNKELKLWNAATFQVVRTLTGGAAWIDFNPSGNVVLGGKTNFENGDPQQVNRWDAASGDPLPSLTLKNLGGYCSLALAPDGKTLFAVRQSPIASSLVQVHDAETGAEKFAERKDHAGPVLAAAFGSQGRLLATGGADGSVKLWDLDGWQKGEPLPACRTLTGHAGMVWSVQFSPDGKLVASGSLDRTIRLWDAASGELVHKLTGHSNTYSRIAFSPDGKTIAAGQENGMVRFWDVATGTEKTVWTGHAGVVRCVAYSPDGKLLASSGVDKTVQVYETATEQLVQSFTLGNIVDRVAFSPDGKLLGATTDDTSPSTLNLWTVATWKQVSLPSHSANVPSVAFSAAGPLAATGGGEGIVRFWNLSGDAPQTLSVGPGPFGAWPYDLAFTPEGRYLATANCSGTVTILRAPPLLPAYNPGPPRKVPTADELAKKPSAADALDPKVMVQGLLNDALLKGQLPVVLGGKGKFPAGLVAILGGKDGHTGQVYGVAIRPDGKMLASAGDDRTVRLWDLATGKLQNVLTAHQDRVYCVAYSPDCQLLASGAGDGCIKLWNAETGKELYSMQGHKGLVAAVVFSPDSKMLVTTGEDGLVRLWDTVGKSLRVLVRGSCTVWSASFSPDGKTLAAAVHDDGIVSLWDVATGWKVAALKGHAKAWVRSVAFSPDGRTLASSTHSSEDPIRLWDLAELRPKKLLAGHTSSVISVCWDAAGRQLATIGDTDGTARVWDTTASPPKSKVLQVIPPGQSWLHYVTFTPEGRYLATANPDGTIYIIRLAGKGTSENK